MKSMVFKPSLSTISSLTTANIATSSLELQHNGFIRVRDSISKDVIKTKIIVTPTSSLFTKAKENKTQKQS